MAKKLSDIDLKNRTRAEKFYALSQDPTTTDGERENAWKKANKPPFKSFLQDINLFSFLKGMTSQIVANRT